MSGVNGNGNGMWKKAGLILLPFLLAGFVNAVVTHTRVSDLRDTAAHKDVVAAQFTDLDNQLRAIQAQLDRIERKVQ